MTHFEIIEKLIGPIRPLGDSARDGERFNNLQAMCELGTKIIQAIDAVAYDHKDSYENSRMKAGKFAEGWLQGVGEELKEATHE